MRAFHRKKPVQHVARSFLVELLNFRIDMQTVKLMIRELELSDENNPVEKWKNVFSLILTAIHIYDKPRTVANFTSGRSYLKLPLNLGKNFLMQIEIKNSWTTYVEEKFLFMIADKNRKEELWVTTIN
jgi:hypothetical protein